jgi:hypothetical protein
VSGPEEFFWRHRAGDERIPAIAEDGITLYEFLALEQKI